MKNLFSFLGYKGLSMLAYAAPLIVLFKFNYAAYVKPRATLGFLGYLMLMLIAIACKGKLAAFSKKNAVFTISAVIFVVALIMQYLAEQLLFISSASLLGCGLSVIVDKVADVYFEASFEIKETSDGHKAKRINTDYIPNKKAWRMAHGFPV